MPFVLLHHNMFGVPCTRFVLVGISLDQSRSFFPFNLVRLPPIYTTLLKLRSSLFFSFLNIKFSFFNSKKVILLLKF